MIMPPLVAGLGLLFLFGRRGLGGSLAAKEASAVALAIVIAIYRNRKTPLVDEYDSMKD